MNTRLQLYRIERIDTHNAVQGDFFSRRKARGVFLGKLWRLHILPSHDFKRSKHRLKIDFIRQSVHLMSEILTRLTNDLCYYDVSER